MDEPEDEKFCRLAFDRYLRGHIGMLNTDWRRGEDPPDYYLIVKGQQFAVEVTAIVLEIEQVPLVRDSGTTSTGQERMISEIGLCEGVARLVSDIESDTVERGVLHGLYVVHFDEPFDRFSESRRQLRKQIVDFITRTQLTDRAGPTEIITSSGPSCFVEKYATDDDGVEHTIGSPGGGWPDDVSAEQSQVLERAISKKAKNRKLASVTVPKMLLLLDRYHLAPAKSYQSCVQRISSRGAFRSVFLVSDDGSIQCLWSEPGAVWNC